MLLTLYPELRDRHGNRPSRDQVLQHGQNFTITSEDSVVLDVTLSSSHDPQTQSSLSGNQLLWMILQSPTGACFSNLLQFTFNPPRAADNHPISLSVPLITSLYQRRGFDDAGELYAFNFQGIIGFPEGVTESHQPFCESYYSYSADIPIAISQRQSITLRRWRDDYMYSFAVTLNDVAELKDDGVVHIAAEESVVNQKHVIASREMIMECAPFCLSMTILDVDKKLHSVFAA